MVLGTFHLGLAKKACGLPSLLVESLPWLYLHLAAKGRSESEVIMFCRRLGFNDRCWTGIRISFSCIKVHGARSCDRYKYIYAASESVEQQREVAEL
jgi:hypothetical protein